MKKTLITLLLTAVVLGLSQSATAQSKESMLCKKWKIDFEAFMKELPEEVKAMMDMMPPDQKALFDAQMKAMEEGYVIFKKDGTMEAKMDPNKEEPESGTWKFSADKTELITTVESEEKETTLVIVELSSGKMTLQEKGKPQDPAITFLPF